MGADGLIQGVVFLLQFALIIAIIVKVFFFSDDDKILRKIEALEIKLSEFNSKFDAFRKREARAIIIAKRVEALVQRSKLEKL